MLLTQVKGHVVSSAKVDDLTGKKLLVVEIMNVGKTGIEGTGRFMVCIDAVGAGEGEMTLAVMGSSARLAPGMSEVPTDGVIVGIIDSLQAFGRDFEIAGSAP
ncbi:MAG: EutN/CcmL family microcompartment protein [Gemmatimonadetes bacterium]|jgi:ethanolamine utilization protein EutN|nr:EutN/CcmL family microcompartment protein [Gemmatimonadota bacterium]